MICTTGNSGGAFFLQTPQHFCNQRAMLSFPVCQLLIYHSVFCICRTGKILRHAPPGSVIAPLQLYFHVFLPRLPEFQNFSTLPGKDPDAHQCGSVGFFAPIEPLRYFLLLSRQSGCHCPIDGCQFHGLPL